MVRETAADIGNDRRASAQRPSARVCAAIADESTERENAEDAGEHADVAKTISLVRGGAVCHPDTIIRLKPARPTGFEHISGWPAFLLNSVPLAAPGAKGSGIQGGIYSRSPLRSVWHDRAFRTRDPARIAFDPDPSAPASGLQPPLNSQSGACGRSSLSPTPER